MRHTFVVAEEDVEGHRREGDTALDKVILGADTGSQLLEQHVVRYAPGRSLPRGEEKRDELLFVVSGTGTLELEGEPHPLEPDSGVYVRAGERYSVDNEGPDDLRRLDHRAGRAGLPLAARGRRPLRRPAGAARRRQAHVPLPRQPGRGLHGRDAVRRHRRAVSCTRPQPLLRRGRLHRRGFAHIGGDSMPLRAGSCFHLPPETVHCIENTGPGVMRILGVFHLSGDPASRVYEDNSEVLSAS